MPAPIPFSMRPTTRRAAEAPPPPPPGFFEGLGDSDVRGAIWRGTRDDIPGHMEEERWHAYGPLIDALVERGQRVTDYHIQNTGVVEIGALNVRPILLPDTIWRDAKRLGLPGLPATREEFDRQWQAKMAQRQGRDARTAARGGLGTHLTVGLPAAFTDDFNLATLQVGGVGKHLVTRLLWEGVAQAGVTALELPLVDIERRVQGRPELTEAEALLATGTGFAGGVAFRGIFETPGLARAGFEKAVAANWERLPQGLRDRWSARSTLPPHEADALTADLAETIIGRDNMSEAEAGAADWIRRGAQAEAGSPFVPNGAAAELHPRLLGEAMQRILDDAPVSPSRATASLLERGQALPQPLPRAGGGLRDSTAIASRTVQPGDAAPGAQQAFMARVRRQESGGSDTARNPRSSAAGRYQFTDGTWLAYYKRRFGSQGMSDAQILARKGDGALQDTLMRDLTADNAAFLRSRGEAVSEGNLYLVHFAGQGGARRLFEADPDAPVRQVLGDAVVDANPHLAGMTAADAIAWAHRAMGAAPSRRAGARAEVQVGEEGFRQQLQEEIDGITARLDALAGERGVDAEQALPQPLPRAGGEPLDLPAPLEDPALQARDADLPDVAPFMAELRAIVATPGRSLNDIDGIAAELGASGEEVRRALGDLVAEGRIAQRRDTGTFMRKPPAPTRGQRSLLEWIADRGGIEDRGGDLAAMGAGGWHREAPFRGKLLKPVDEKQASLLGPGGPRENAPDILFGAAISEGYFPELMGRLDQAGRTDLAAEKPDVATFFSAIERELRGEPRYSVDARKGEFAEEAAPPDQFELEPWEAARARFREEWETFGNDPADLPDDYLAAAADLYERGEAFTPEHAVQMAIAEELAAIRSRVFDETADAVYGSAYDPFDPNWSERLAADAEFQRQFEDAAARAVADAGGGGGRTGEPGDAGPRGEDGADAVRAAEDGYAEGLSLAALAPEQRAPFLDPDGDAAKAQADSLLHDFRAKLAKLDELLPPGSSREYRVESEAGFTALGRATIGEELPGVRRAIAVQASKLGILDEHFEAIISYQGGPATFGSIKVRYGDAEALGPKPEGARLFADGDAPTLLHPDEAAKLDMGEVVDPAIAARQAQEAALGAEAPMRAAVDQESTLGLGLFGAADGVRLDAEGEARPLKDLLDEIEAEEAEIKNIRDCL